MNNPRMNNPAGMSRKRLLLADDDELFREGFAALLRSDGYECICAADGAAALALLRQSSFDAMISDIFMPGNVDLEMVAAVPQIAAGLPVILLTGRPVVDTAIKAVNLALAGYMLKPPDMAVLRPILDRAIEGYCALRKIGENRRKFEGWAHDLGRIEKLLKDPAASDKVGAVAQYLQTISASYRSVLGDMEQTLELLVRLRNSGAAVEEHAMIAALHHAMETLEQTRQNFKSKRLARLRHDLANLLHQHGG